MLIDCCIWWGEKNCCSNIDGNLWWFRRQHSGKKWNIKSEKLCYSSSSIKNTCITIAHKHLLFQLQHTEQHVNVDFLSFQSFEHKNYAFVKLLLIWLFACAFVFQRIITTIVVEWKVINVATIQHLAHFIYCSLSIEAEAAAAFHRSHCCHTLTSPSSPAQILYRSHTHMTLIFMSFFFIFQIWYAYSTYKNVDLYMKIAFKSLI